VAIVLDAYEFNILEKNSTRLHKLGLVTF